MKYSSEKHCTTGPGSSELPSNGIPPLWEPLHHPLSLSTDIFSQCLYTHSSAGLKQKNILTSITPTIAEWFLKFYTDAQMHTSHTPSSQKLPGVPHSTAHGALLEDLGQGRWPSDEDPRGVLSRSATSSLELGARHKLRRASVS